MRTLLGLPPLWPISAATMVCLCICLCFHSHSIQPYKDLLVQTNKQNIPCKDDEGEERHTSHLVQNENRPNRKRNAEAAAFISNEGGLRKYQKLENLCARSCSSTQPFQHSTALFSLPHLRVNVIACSYICLHFSSHWIDVTGAV